MAVDLGYKERKLPAVFIWGHQRILKVPWTVSRIHSYHSSCCCCYFFLGLLRRRHQLSVTGLKLTVSPFCTLLKSKH